MTIKKVCVVCIGAIEIYNSLGNIVLANQNQTNTLPFKVNLGTLTNGIYIVRVYDKKSGTSFTKKILKL